MESTHDEVFLILADVQATRYRWVKALIRARKCHDSDAEAMCQYQIEELDKIIALMLQSLDERTRVH